MRTVEERIKRILQYYGPRQQCLKCAEEIAEFQTELMKCINQKGNREHLAEEMADMLLTVEYVKLVFGIEDKDIQMIMKQKLDRTESRMEHGEFM